MPEEYIRSSKACVYVLGGAANTASLFEFDGVYVLDGGFAERSQGFVANVREVVAVLLSSPTIGNLGTTTALLGQEKPVPVFTNTKPLKATKPGSSGELVKSIQESNSKLIFGTSPIFDPKYPAHIIYQSVSKGILTLYILAGDAKDAEVITKSLASGNEEEVERAAAAHGTVGVLLWRPALADKPAVRVLVSGTCSLSRIQQSLDKAAKSLPFLNAASVKSKDALSATPAPATPKAPASLSGRPATGKPAATRPTTSGPTGRPAPTIAARPLTSRAPVPNGSARPAAKPGAPTAAPKAATSAPRPARPASAKAPVPAKAPARAPVPARNSATTRPSATKTTEPVAQKKTVGKVQGAAPAKPAAPATKKAPTPKAEIPPAATTARVPIPSKSEPSDANVTIVLDDSDSEMAPAATGHGLNDGPMDIIVIPPTPEPPRQEVVADHHDEPKEKEEEAKPDPVESPKSPITDNVVEDVIPEPVDAFKKPEPVPSPVDETPKYDDVEDVVPPPVDAFKKPDPEPSPAEDVTGAYPKIGDDLDDFDPLKPSHPEPSAPAVPQDHVIISTPDPNLPDIAAAVPFIPPTPRGADDGLIRLEDDPIVIAPGFEEPLIPQAPREDGTLADCSEEISKLVEISMDTDKSTEAGEELAKAIGDVTQLSHELQNLGLDEKTDEYVRKLSNQMIQDATLPFTSALASSIVSSNGSQEHQDSNGHNGNSNGVQDAQKEIPKHDLMQSRSSVLENGAPVEYEKTDPALDDILNACAQESEIIDAVVSSSTPSHPDTLHMPAAPGTSLAKSVKFARPYYFDVVTVPRNEKMAATVTADELQEFIFKVRSRNVILASKDISSDQLQGILNGKQMWCDAAHPCTIIPTHSSPILLDFRQKNEDQFANNHLTFVVPVEKQRTTVSSENGEAEYELAKISLE